VTRNVYRAELGQQFSRLTIVELLPKGPYEKQMYRCRCVCGVEKMVVKSALVTGATKSCGCWRVDVGRILGKRGVVHGESSTSRGGATVEYRAWRGMIDRCHNPANKYYRNYGGRGITVCMRWRKSFPNFLSDVGRRPSAKHSLDRIKNHLGYRPGNVKWSTQAEQVRNSRYGWYGLGTQIRAQEGNDLPASV